MKITNEEKKNMFKKAHEIARNTRFIVGDYMVAFKLALKNLWLQYKFTCIESKLGKMITDTDFYKKLCKEGKSFSTNSVDFRISESVLDTYYNGFIMTFAEEMYLVFCSFFGESVVNDWLGI